MWKRQVRCCQEQKESETDYGTLYTRIQKEKYLSGVTYEITAREDIVTPEGTVWFHKGRCS